MSLQSIGQKTGEYLLPIGKELFETRAETAVTLMVVVAIIVTGVGLGCILIEFLSPKGERFLLQRSL